MKSPKPLSRRLLVISSLFATTAVYAASSGWDAPAAVEIPLYFDSAGRYVMDVSMSNGTGRQNFTFTFSTGTGMTYVASDGGTLMQAGGPPLYNATKSVTAQVVNSDASTAVFGEPANTSVIKEACAISDESDSFWTYSNQTIILVKDIAQNVLEAAANVELGKDVSGIIGLGTNRQNMPTTPGEYKPTFEDSVIGQHFQIWPTAANFTFGMAVGSPAIAPAPDGGVVAGSPLSGSGVLAGSDAGLLHLLQPDPEYYNSNQVSWVTTDFSAGANNGSIPPSDWTVVLDGWVASTQTNQLSSKGQIVADLDPLYTDIYVPQDQAAVIHAAIPGAQLQQGISTLGNLSMAYTLPCNTQFTFGLVVGSQTFVLDQSSLIVTMSNGQCVSGIEAWTDPQQAQYMFGSRFLSTVYLIFNVPRNGTQSIGFSPRASDSNKSSLDVKAIIGGTIGGAAVVVFAILGALFLRRYHRRTFNAVPTAPSINNYDEVPKSPGSGWHVEPFTMASPTQTFEHAGFQPPLKMPVVPNRPGEHGSPSTTGRVLSPLTSSVIFIDDDRSINVAPPSYRGHDSQSSIPPSPGAQTTQTTQTGVSAAFSTRATCGV